MLTISPPPTRLPYRTGCQTHTQAHDSASGYLPHGGVVDHQLFRWTKTQPGGVGMQLGCGARALDWRPAVSNSQLVMHHGDVIINHTMASAVAEMVECQCAAAEPGGALCRPVCGAQGGRLGEPRAGDHRACHERGGQLRSATFSFASWQCATPPLALGLSGAPHWASSARAANPTHASRAMGSAAARLGVYTSRVWVGLGVNGGSFFEAEPST